MGDEATGQNLKFDVCVSEIVAAYVANNRLHLSELPKLIASVRAAVGGLAHVQRPTAAPDPKATEAQIRKSITWDALISFIDGKPYKALKRHLTGQGLDPVSYRQKYGLPVDYPMVAPSYSERRSTLSREHHFGNRNRP